MIRSLVLGWLFVILTLSGRSVAAPKSPTDLTVVVVSAGTLDWPQARRTVEAELTATGFQVNTRSSAVGTPGKLIDELRLSGQGAPPVRGAVAVFREGGEGRAYVWIPERENLLQVDAPAGTGAMEAEVLALRIVELLRVRLLDEPPAKEAEPRGLDAAWVALGPWFALGFDQPILDFTVAASFRLTNHLALDLSGHMSARPGRADTDVGTVTASATALTVHGTWLAHRSEHFAVAMGPGGGALLFEGSGLGRGPYVGRNESAVVGLLSLRGRVTWRTSDLAFLLLLEPGATLPAIAPLADEVELYRFGQPLLLGSLGVGWSG